MAAWSQTSCIHAQISHLICTIPSLRWIIPTCPDHNKGLSCKTFQVKRVIAVEAPPKFKARAASWKYEFVKLAETWDAFWKKSKK